MLLWYESSIIRDSQKLRLLQQSYANIKFKLSKYFGERQIFQSLLFACSYQQRQSQEPGIPEDELILQQLMEVQECRKLQVTIVRKIQSTLSASSGIASRLWWGCYHSSSFSFIVIDSIVLKDTASAFYISDETEQRLGWFHVTQCFWKISVLSLVFLPNSKHDCSFLSISVGE